MSKKLDYNLCMVAGQDAGNRNMRKHSRKQWNEKDWNVASKISNHLLAKLNQRKGYDIPVF